LLLTPPDVRNLYRELVVKFFVNDNPQLISSSYMHRIQQGI
jgi:hypothetical protein